MSRVGIAHSAKITTPHHTTPHRTSPCHTSMFICFKNILPDLDDANDTEEEGEWLAVNATTSRRAPALALAQYIHTYVRSQGKKWRGHHPIYAKSLGICPTLRCPDTSSEQVESTRRRRRCWQQQQQPWKKKQSEGWWAPLTQALIRSLDNADKVGYLISHGCGRRGIVSSLLLFHSYEVGMHVNKHLYRLRIGLGRGHPSA